MTVLPAIPPDWIAPPTLRHAADVQRQLAARVITHDDGRRFDSVAGVDISHLPRQPGALVHAAFVVLDALLNPVREACASLAPTIPYVPGFLGFREVPAQLAAFAALPGAPPDLIMVDGHGISHPRGLGVASHLGVLLDIPTIGVAKSILVGEPAAVLPPDAGAQCDLVWEGRVIGRVIRTRKGANPIYVSIGHRIGLQTAVDAVWRAAAGRRLPEPTRHAHLAANACRIRA